MEVKNYFKVSKKNIISYFSEHVKLDTIQLVLNQAEFYETRIFVINDLSYKENFQYKHSLEHEILKVWNYISQINFSRYIMKATNVCN